MSDDRTQAQRDREAATQSALSNDPIDSGRHARQLQERREAGRDTQEWAGARHQQDRSVGGRER